MCGITTFAKRELSSRPLVQSAGAEAARRNTDFSDFIAATFCTSMVLIPLAVLGNALRMPVQGRASAERALACSLPFRDRPTLSNDLLPAPLVHNSAGVARNSRAKSSNFAAARSEIAQ